MVPSHSPKDPEESVTYCLSIDVHSVFSLLILFHLRSYNSYRNMFCRGSLQYHYMLKVEG